MGTDNCDPIVKYKCIIFNNCQDLIWVNSELFSIIRRGNSKLPFPFQEE